MRDTLPSRKSCTAWGSDVQASARKVARADSPTPLSART
jgi:hypothetical protein